MKKLKGIVLAVILLLASIMMPFDVYADTISNSNVNINYYLDSVTEVSSGSYLQTYRVEFVFDQSYLGWISSRMVGTYIIDNNLPITTSQFTKTQAIYVNGAVAETSFTIVTQNTQNGGALQSLSQSIQNSNVTPLADLSTLDDILNVLTDIQNTLDIDVMDDLDQILIDVGLASDYLEQLTLFRQWDIPFESFGFVHYLLSNNYQVFDYSTYNYYYFPIFKLNQNDLLMSVYIRNGRTFRFILGVNAYWTSESNIRSALNVPNTLTIENISTIDTIYSKTITGYGSYINIVKFDLTNKSGSGIDYKAYVNNGQYQNTLIVPIYANFINNNVSTDFALRFGLSNKLLDDIHIIAQGTNQSNSAASDLESSNDQMADDMDDLASIENGYNQQFNNQLQQIDFSSPLQSNAGILPAANFVITIFNGLINNNPFSVLIIIVCILLIGKKVIGK